MELGYPHLCKLYEYGLCEGKPTPKIAGYKVQDSSILGTFSSLGDLSFAHLCHLLSHLSIRTSLDFASLLSAELWGDTGENPTHGWLNLNLRLPKVFGNNVTLISSSISSEVFLNVKNRCREEQVWKILSNTRNLEPIVFVVNPCICFKKNPARDTCWLWHLSGSFLVFWSTSLPPPFILPGFAALTAPVLFSRSSWVTGSDVRLLSSRIFLGCKRNSGPSKQGGPRIQL